MAERSAPLASAPTVTVTMLEPSPRHVLRGGDAMAAQVGTALGLVMPTTPCRSARNGAVAALWLGPDEWLLLGDVDLGTALDGTPHALVDISHRQIALQVAGPGSTDLINTGCLLDLDDAVFPVGACTRTVFAQAEIVLWRTSEHVFRLEVARSFADYVWLYLAEAAA